MSDKSAKQFSKEEIEKFGSNTWFVEALYEDFLENPDSVPEQWKQYFKGEQPSKTKSSSTAKTSGTKKTTTKDIQMPTAGSDDELKIIAGSSARIVDNMEDSLSVPVATSQRVIPVKLMEENRLLLNNYLIKEGMKKISFTHIVGYAIVKALQIRPAMNNAYTEKDGKPQLIIRKHINIGLAIDVERKDGSRSLLVPNIKHAEKMNFREFVDAYNELVTKSRKGTIDPDDFFGTTVSLTNPGMIGTVSSIPRLMLGQGTIIATGAIQYPAEYQAMAPDTISTLGISKVFNISSTYDHRVIQGAESGLFLKELHEILLGKDNFYQEMYDDLGLPLKALAWQKDISPKGFDGGTNYEEIAKQGRVRQLINMYRVRGHLIASIDPLGTKTVYHQELDPSFYDLTLWDLDRKYLTHDFGSKPTATLREILDILHKTYCDKIGVEYMHIQEPKEKAWLQQRMEPIANHPNFDDGTKIQILKKLVIAEGMEHFIHTRFVGHKRFSLEGSETLLPVLDYLLTIAADNAVHEVVLGMAHRGRINVLANIVGKSYEMIFSEFEDVIDPNSFAGSGDVKYHLGAFGKYQTRFRRHIGVSIAPNPSHLEWVNPVVEGIARAKQTRMNDRERLKVIPILIHGDAAFAGQGVVTETINLSQLKGYKTGGTVHIIINNQIGFTTTPEDARSSVYATDVAKMIQAPIFHVNGDHPEEALFVTKLAFEYRQMFKKDVVIDLLGYRRHGHNEGDEPGFTQPLLYNKIKNHPSVLQLYARKLIEEGYVTEQEYQAMNDNFKKRLDEALEFVTKKREEFKIDIPLAVSKERVLEKRLSPATGTKESTLNEIVEKTTELPETFNGHPKLRKFLDKRKEFLNKDDALVDWAFAETLAFGTLLLEGTPVRLSGQDSVRGTFSQRHLAFTDINTGKEYFPLNHISEKQAQLEALDSLLSEAAVMGFEYGYSSADPLALVLWEAQFGDFVNSAQVIIDNFIVASDEKWHAPNNLVLLLPHGYEGQGPEHSSARLERFLILCAEESMEVCYPSTPAQYYHLLRRQMKKDRLRPLVTMTPKSLLRLPECRSPKSDFLEGRFLEIIDDQKVTKKEEITRIILTSGKIYYDLRKYQKEHKIDNVAVVRLEQFYPFEKEKISTILKQYKKAKEVAWVQEEPRNMGALYFLYSRLPDCLSKGQKLEWISRPEGASPAVGSSRIAKQQQQDIVKSAFGK